MSPRLRRRRNRPGTASPPSSPPAEASPAGAAPGRPAAPRPELSGTGDQVAERLLAAVGSGTDGRLDLVGDPGGQVYLEDGRVVLVESALTPGLDLLLIRRTGSADWAEARDLVERGELGAHVVEALRQHAVADAAAALLATDGTTLVRSRFVPGEQPWTRLSRPLAAEELLAEAGRRRHLAVRLGVSVRTGSRPARAPRLPTPAVRLTAVQWDLVATADGRRTVRDLAWMHGVGVYATVLEVAALQRQGLLVLTSPLSRQA